MSIHIGDKIRFQPEAFVTTNGKDQRQFGAMDHKVVGRVCLINRANRWFRVRYETPFGIQHECFNFEGDNKKWQKIR